MLPSRRDDGNNKYIYVMRSGTDVCYSFYHHLSNQDEASGGTGSAFPTFPHFAQQWLDGQLPYGKWTDHVCAWLEEGVGEQVLVVTYEDLFVDLESQVQRIAKFIGLEALSAVQLEELLPKLTFAGMRSKSTAFSPISVKWKDPTFNFLRKGTVGDSKETWAALDSRTRTQFVDMCKQTLTKLPGPMHALFESLVPLGDC